MGYTLALKSVKKKQDPFQNFQKLQKKVENLRKQQSLCEKSLSKDLEFYSEKILPKQNDISEVLKTQIELLHPYLKQKKYLSKKDRGYLKIILLDLFEKKQAFQDTNELVDPILDTIFKELTGYSHLDAQLVEFEEFKKTLEEDFADRGFDIDLDNLSINESREDIMRKIFESFGETAEKLFEEEKNKPKSKKQLEKERIAFEIAEIQKKEISTIYKQLAKIFHPDLEENPAFKQEKEALMKQLTVAYEKKDLQTLLELEMRWLTQEGQSNKVYSEKQIQIYAQVLKEQIASLENDLHMQFHHPRYIALHRFINYDWKKGSQILEEALLEIEKHLKLHSDFIEKLKKEEPISVIRTLIKEEAFFVGTR